MTYLFLKHIVATSALAPFAETIRSFLDSLRNLRSPELALLRCESRMQKEVIKRLLKDDSSCVDVGAHIGSVSYFLQRVAPRGQHLIVEAVPSKAEWLKKRFPKAVVHQCALSDSSGQICFHENLDNSGFSSALQRSGWGSLKQIYVDCSTLDELLREKKRIDFIKIDVEGYELHVIKGGATVILELRPILILRLAHEKIRK